jgi:acyl-CoA synthetase (AMP-forming)/AMP-acid ligase II
MLVGAAGTSAVVAYINAKFHIAHDLKNARGGLTPSPEVVDFITDRVGRKRILNYHVFEDQALRSRPNHTFLIFEGKTWTYKEFFDCITRVGNYLMNDLHIGIEEVVAINGGNSPEYLMLWFALDAIGAVPSFVNWNLTGPGLVHCAQVRYQRLSIQVVSTSLLTRTSCVEQDISSLMLM